MTEVKTIGDYINALPDEIREVVRVKFHQENVFSESDKYLNAGIHPLWWIVDFTDSEWENEWENLADTYTLKQKEGKYYTNW